MEESRTLFGSLSNTISVYRRPILFICCLILVISTRIGYLVGPIDDPHAWRQCDTANYALAFYRDGIDLLRPSVCWMGDYRTVILEFPFPEAVMALTYKIFGPHLCFARIITLLFFGGSAVYFYYIVKYLFHTRLAFMATAVYIVLPLSIFYSRAVHIDFFAVFFAHAMTYYLIRGYEDCSIRYTFAGMMAGCLAFMVKAPYVFYFVIPISVLVIKARRARNLIVLCAAVLMPVLVFFLWRQHVAAVNGAAPDWFFIPGYMKFLNMNNWYFGPLSMRWDLSVWERIFQRFYQDIASKTGTWLFVFGLIASIVRARSYGIRSVWFAWMWLGGVIVYLATFLNLNYVHDYYQIPFLAIVALFIGIAFDTIYGVFNSYTQRFGWLPSFCIYLILAYNCISYAELNYFWTDEIRIEAGRIIERVTPPGSIVIAAPDIPGTDCRDPRLLYRAKRNGWSVYERYLSKKLIADLKTCGAQYLTLVTKWPDDVRATYGYPADIYPLKMRPWKVFVCKL